MERVGRTRRCELLFFTVSNRGVAMLRTASLVPLCAALLCWCAPSVAQERFTTPEAAVDALVGAAKAGDAKALVGVLGPDGKAIVSSGDPVADTNIREKFVAAYEAKHAIEREGDGTQTLIIGADDLPFPIPLVNRAGEWQLTPAGLTRFAPARRPQRALRDPGQSRLCPGAKRICLARSRRTRFACLCPADLEQSGKEGWPLLAHRGGRDPSPLGELAAKTSAEGYKAGAAPIPYDGYYYRILTRQGADAPGGAYDYLVNGKMIGGFALLAFPAEYGNRES